MFLDVNKISNTKYLVFSGGAAKGYAHLGVLEVLRDVFTVVCGFNIIDRIEGYGGSSFGAIVALACSLGLELSVITKWFMSVDTSDILGSMNLINFYDAKGLIKHTYLYDKICDLLKERFGPLVHDVTFSYLYKRTRKILKVVVSNISTSEYEVWSYETHPNMPVATAIIASAAVPFILEPVIIKQNVYLDGGLYHNFPINIFPAEQVIGVKLSSLPNFIDIEKHGLQQYMMHVIGSSSAFYERCYFEQLGPVYQSRTITVNISVPMSSMELLNPSMSLKSELIQTGRRHAMCYCLDKNDVYICFALFKLWEMLIAWNYFELFLEVNRSAIMLET